MDFATVQADSINMFQEWYIANKANVFINNTQYLDVFYEVCVCVLLCVCLCVYSFPCGCEELVVCTGVIRNSFCSYSVCCGVVDAFAGCADVLGRRVALKCLRGVVWCSRLHIVCACVCMFVCFCRSAHPPPSQQHTHFPHFQSFVVFPAFKRQHPHVFQLNIRPYHSH